MSDQPNPEKIIVDEDWKSRVEAEKEATLNKASAGEAEKPSEEAAASDQGDDDPTLPPADLMFVLGTMYMQALIGLGLVANPMTGKPKVRLHQAQHAIDTLEMLRQKTEGHRTAEESGALDNMLHELRMAFVATQQHRAPGT